MITPVEVRQTGLLDFHGNAVLHRTHQRTEISMAGPIDKTMQVLVSTANPRSLEVLIAALDIDQTDIQQLAQNDERFSRGRQRALQVYPDDTCAKETEECEIEMSKLKYKGVC